MVKIDIKKYNELIFRLGCKITKKFGTDRSMIRIYGIPKNGSIIALSLVTNPYFKSHMTLCTNGIDVDVLIDDLIDSGRTKEKYMYQHPDAYFFTLIDKKKEYNNEWIHFWFEKDYESDAASSVVRQIEMIGEDPNREGLLNTPERVVKSWEKLYSGYKQNSEDIFTTFESDGYDQMVLLKDIEFYSTCEHHMLPFFGKAHIAYIPNKRIVGISKLARLLEIYTRRLQVQERIGQQVINDLDEYLKPKGSACILEAKHLCMTCRGIEKQNSVMTTSSLSGLFRKNEVRTELMRLI